MARKLDVPALGRKEIYPWDEWFDGAVWELTRPEDFDRPVEKFMAQVYGAAARHGKKAVIQPVDAKTLRVQAVPR